MLSDKAVQEFREIFEKDFGKKLSDQEAKDSAERLVGFFEFLIKVDRRNKEEKAKK